MAAPTSRRWSSNINEGDIMGNIDLRCSGWPPATRRAKIEDRRNYFAAAGVGGLLEPTKSIRAFYH